MQDVRLSIEGMHCDGCAARLQGLLEREPGVRQAAVSFPDREARVRINPHAVERGRLAEVVRRAGFDVAATG